MEDLCNYADFLDATAQAPAPLRERAEWLLHSYGPASLTQDIKAISPDFVPASERFNRELRQ